MSNFFKILLVGVVLFISSCTNGGYEVPPVVSEKYRIVTVTNNATEIPKLYVNAENIDGGINITDENGEEKFIKDDELFDFIVNMFTSASGSGGFMNLNYIDFVSNENLVISYNDSEGKEFIYPDMLKEDGSLRTTLKYRRTFDEIVPRTKFELASFLRLPITGELPQASYGISYRFENGYKLIYLNYTTLKSYLEMMPLFGVTPEVITMLNGIVGQYSRTSDTLEIGIYFEQIN